MPTIDQRKMEAGVLVGLFGQYFEVCMDDDRIRRRWLEKVPVVERDFVEV